MSPKVRFVISGTGAIAPSHAEAICRQRNAELVAFFGTDQRRVEILATKYGVSGYNNFEKLCETERFEVVDIATHSGRHAWIGGEAVLKGKHLLIEKPITTTLEEGEWLVQSCVDAGVALGVIYQHRFDPDLQQVKQWIENDSLGEILWACVSLVSSRDSSYYHLHEGRSDPRLTGGGVLINQGIHFIDILQWLLGPVRAVYGQTENRLHHLPFEDTGVGILQFVSGAFATFTATTASRFPQPSRIEIEGSFGSLVMENCRLKKIVRKGRSRGKGGRLWRGDQSNFQKAGSHEDVIRDFVDALLQGRSPRVDGRESLKSLQIVMALYESNRSGKPVILERDGAVVALEKVTR